MTLTRFALHKTGTACEGYGRKICSMERQTSAQRWASISPWAGWIQWTWEKVRIQLRPLYAIPSTLAPPFLPLSFSVLAGLRFLFLDMECTNDLLPFHSRPIKPTCISM